MRRPMLPLALAAALLAPFPEARAAECYQVVNVDAWDVLFIRSRRDHRSKAVGAIAPDHNVAIRATGPCLPRGASRRQQWCPVSYSPLQNVERHGFVKAYYIRSVACP